MTLGLAPILLAAWVLYFRDPDVILRESSASDHSVALLLDSLEFQANLTAEERRQAERLKSPDRVTIEQDLAARKQFFARSFSVGETVSVAAGTKASVQAYSGYKCGVSELGQGRLVQVKIVDGPKAGLSGWMCEDFIVRPTVIP